MSFLFSLSVCLCLIFLLLSSLYWFNEQPQAHTVRPHANAYEYQNPKVFVCGISLSQCLFLSLSLWHTHTHTHTRTTYEQISPSETIYWYQLDSACVCSCGGKAAQGLRVQSHIRNFYCGSMTCYWTVNYLKKVYMKSSKLQCCHDYGHFFNLKISSSCTNNRPTVNPVFLKRYYNRELSKAKTKSKKLWSC